MPQGFVEVSGYSKTDVDRKVDDYLQSLRWNGIVTTQAVYPELNENVVIWTNKAINKDTLIVLELFVRRAHDSGMVVPVVTCTSSSGQIKDLTTALSGISGISADTTATLSGTQYDFGSLAYIYALTGANANVNLSYKITGLRARCVHSAAIIPITT